MKLALIGTGKLGSSLLAGITAREVLPREEIGVIGRDPAKVALVAEKFGVRQVSRRELAEAERILLCVQPRVFPEVAEWASFSGAGYISTLAGVTLEQLRGGLSTARVVRTMPNLAATTGQSQTALCATKAAQEAGDLDFAAQLFGAVGDTYILPEHLFDAFTGMSASALAYAATFAEALADGGVRQGLPRATANELARKVLVSAGSLLETREHPALLKDQVCSPGGTTIAGMQALERSGFRAGIIDAVEAATLRGRELGQGN